MAFSPILQRPFSATFDRRAAAAAAGNGLLNALIAYWPMNEAAGANNALDLHSNGLTLTQVSSPGADTGLVYPTARQFVRASGSHFERASEALLQTSESTDFTCAVWINLSTTIKAQALIARRSGAASGEFTSFYGSTGKFEFFIRDSDWRGVIANAFGALTSGVWYLVIMQHESAIKSISISVNAGTPDTLAYFGTFLATNATLGIGHEVFSGGSEANALIGPVAFWKSAAGGGGVLTAAQRTALYNGGAGLAYANFTA